eukprot:6212428-Pleurochrysis_carterae.AAC.1
MPLVEHSDGTEKDLDFLWANVEDVASKDINFTTRDLIHFASFRLSGIRLDGTSLLAQSDARAHSSMQQPVMTCLLDAASGIDPTVLAFYPARASILLAMYAFVMMHKTSTALNIFETETMAGPVDHVFLGNFGTAGADIYAAQTFVITMVINERKYMSVRFDVTLHRRDENTHHHALSFSSKERSAFTAQHVMRMVKVPQTLDDVYVAQTQPELEMYMDHSFQPSLHHIYENSWGGDLAYESDSLSLSYGLLAFRKWQAYSAKRVLSHECTLRALSTSSNPIAIAFLLMLYANAIFFLGVTVKKELCAIANRRLHHHAEESRHHPKWLRRSWELAVDIFSHDHRNDDSSSKADVADILETYTDAGEEKLTHRIVKTLFEVWMKVNPVVAFDALDVRIGSRSQAKQNYGSIVTIPPSICFHGMRIDVRTRAVHFSRVSAETLAIEESLRRESADHHDPSSSFMRGEIREMLVLNRDAPTWPMMTHAGCRVAYTMGPHIIRSTDEARFIGRCPYDDDNLWFLTSTLDLADIPADV